MPYIGKSPEHGNFAELNDVSGSFNGSTTQFALTTRIGGIAITPVVESSLLISLDGVIQEPTTDYTVSGTNITFTTAPASTVSFFGVVMGRQLDVGTPSDGTVTQAKLASTFMTGATDIGAAIADADLMFIDDGAGGNLRKATMSRFKTYVAASASDPASADGDALGTASLEWSDLYLADGGVIYFGNDQDVTVTHDPDDGLFLKSTATADDNPFVLTLQTGETDIAANDVLGQIDFQAPDEGQGTDAILVAAGIAAVSEGDFSSSNNATKLSFKTGASEAAAEKMSLSSTGNLTISGDLTVSGDDLTMGTNTSGAALIADGTNFNPVVISGDISIATNGTAAIGAGVIVEADIADNAITLAKMASGTDGNIISYDASGNPVAIATGSDGQVLTSTGAGSPPAFEAAAGGGAWTFISTVTASDDATVELTGMSSSTYNTHALIASQVVTATDDVQMYMEMGTSTAYQSTNYEYHVGEISSASNSYGNNRSEDFSVMKIGSNQGNASGECYGCTLFFSNIGNSLYPVVYGTVFYHNTNSNSFGGHFVGTNPVTTDFDRLRFKASSGNLTSGKFSLYGIKNS